MDQENTNEPMQQEAYAATVDQTASSSAESSSNASNDVDDNKLYAILGYILPFLFFLPLVQDSSKNSPFARFHANQQLILLAAWLAVYVLSTVLYSVLMMGLFFIMPLINLALLALAILGIVHAAQGEMKELPVIGGVNLLDKVFKK